MLLLFGPLFCNWIWPIFCTSFGPLLFVFGWTEFFYRLNRFKQKQKQIVNVSNRPKPIKSSQSNRTVIGRKTDPNRYASVLIITKPIPIGLVTNLKKNRADWTTHTPTHNRSILNLLILIRLNSRPRLKALLVQKYF